MDGIVKGLIDLSCWPTARGINTLGLSCDIIGALLVWRYGLPQSISRTGAIHLIVEQTDEAELQKAKTYDRIAGIGIFLLVLGFVLQLLSNFLR